MSRANVYRRYARFRDGREDDFKNREWRRY
jgi:hypothetical protein